MTLRPIITHLAAAYLGAGIFCASLMGIAIPALNMIGKAYIALAWPKMIYCGRVNDGCDPTPPAWASGAMFTFDRGQP